MKYILIIVFFLKVLTVNCQILEDKDALLAHRSVRSTIKTSPWAMLVGPIILTAEYRLAYETVLSENQSFQLGVSYIGKSFYMRMMEKSDSAYSANNIRFLVTGYRFQFTYKYFFNRMNDSPAGLYIGPHFSYSFAKFTTRQLNLYDEYIKAVYVNYNLITGYQLIIHDKLVIDFFYGLGYRDNAWHEHYNQTNYPLDSGDFLIYKGNLKLILGINAGWAF